MIAPRVTIRAADLFCGAGGSSTGALEACRELGYSLDLTAVNHWPVAVQTHTANHGTAETFRAFLHVLRSMNYRVSHRILNAADYGDGFGALCMTNLFAWRDTKPADMRRAEDPVGPLNDYYLFVLARDAGMVLAAWGKHGNHRRRGDYIRDVYREAGIPLHCLRLNNDGSPEHPLYVPAATEPWIWQQPIAKEAVYA